jgi:hypothetical protein
VTSAAITPPQTAAASSVQPTFTSSQRLRVTLCAQAKSVVRASNSCASNGAPTSIPNSTGAARLKRTRSCPATLPPSDIVAPRSPHVPLAVHPSSMVCHCEAIDSPVMTSTAANAVSSTAAMAACARYSRQTSTLIAGHASLCRTT